MKVVVAIHQPNFLPWLGFFDKILKSDVFVFLDNVQFIKKGGNWGNRVALLIDGRPMWVTMPVHRSYHGYRRTNEIEINNTVPWERKFFNSLKSYYRKHPFFSETMEWLIKAFQCKKEKLAAFNIHIVTNLVESLGWDTSKLVVGSSLAVEGTGTDLLISVVNAAGGASYLCGGGAGGYQEDEKFKQAGLGLIYQNFKHPVYRQNAATQFVQGLSIVEALMNLGIAGTVDLLESGQ